MARPVWRPYDRGMNLTPRQLETYEAVCAHAPASRQTIMRVLRCRAATVQQHLHRLKCLGLIRASSAGRYSRWTAVPLGQAPRVWSDPIEQASSVWEYARRVGVMHGSR